VTLRDPRILVSDGDQSCPPGSGIRLMVCPIVHLCGVAGRQYDLQYIEEKACRHRLTDPMALLARQRAGFVVNRRDIRFI